MQQPATKQNPYLRTKVLTASREELRLMLFDGALRYIRQGRQAIEDKDYEKLYESMNRAQKIVLELSNSLNHEILPDVCDKLSSLYTYIYRLLVDATMERKPAAADEALKLLQYERDTWVMLMDNLSQHPGDPRPTPAATPAPAANPYAAGAPLGPTGTYSRSA